MRGKLWACIALCVALFLFLEGIGRPGARAAVPVWASGPAALPRQAPYRIVINIPAYRLSLFRGDELVKTYPIAVGKAVSPSRIGTCTIAHKSTNPTWYPPDGRPPVPPGPANPVGSRWMGLSWPGYGIHGTNNPVSIGKAVSLGCIRMRDEDARELYEIVPVGTEVEFVYRTIEVWPGDEELGALGARITVYRDIYGRGVNTVEHAKEALAASLPRPTPEVDEGALEAIVAAATGRPEPVPWIPSVEMDGRALLGVARLYGGQVLVALRPVADALGCYVHWDQARGVAVVGGAAVRGVVVSGRLYVPLDDLRRLFVPVFVNWDPQALTLAILTRPPQAAPQERPQETGPIPAPATLPEPGPGPEPEPGPQLESVPMPSPEPEPEPEPGSGPERERECEPEPEPEPAPAPDLVPAPGPAPGNPVLTVYVDAAPRRRRASKVVDFWPPRAER